MKRTLLSVIAMLALTIVTFAQVDVFVEQASGFAAASRGIRHMDAVSSTVVWAVAYDGLNAAGACTDFTRTVNGGTLWTAGTIPGISALALAMVSAIDDQTAWIVAFPPASATTGMGIYKTSNGGTTWARQTTATFANASSFPNCVHFYNANDGWCMGDPINGDFEIYTTNNGGAAWTLVPGSQIANPVSGEFGVVGYTSSIGDTSWFGTNKGRIYKSVDKGLNWTAAAIPGWSAIYCTPAFKDGMHGLAQDRGASTTGGLAESSDGGATWTAVTAVGTVYTNDLEYVPTSPNTYVASGADATNGLAGVVYSFNGGHTWAEMPNTNGIQFLAESWINPQTGWVGAFSTDATTGGMFKFIDNLVQAVPAFETADTAILFGGTATFTNLSTGAATYLWSFQGGTPATSTLQTPPAIQYTAGGLYNVSLTVSNTFTPNTTLTKTGYIKVGGIGINEITKATVTVGPNPATDVVYVNANNTIKEVQVYNLLGQIVFSQKVNNNSLTINTSSIQSGLYNVKVVMTDGSIVKKVVIN